MSGSSYVAMESEKARVNWPLEIGALVLRVTVCLTVVHHGLQKLGNPEGFAENMVAKYFSFLPGPPIYWTYMAAYMELVAPVLLAVGVFARLASFGLLTTMLFATSFHFMLTGTEDYPLGVPAAGAYAFEPSLLCGAIFCYFLFAGPGKLALKPNLL